jgi:hypothetical protein
VVQVGWVIVVVTIEEAWAMKDWSFIDERGLINGGLITVIG